MYPKFKILIVDDEQDVAVVLEDFLRMEGYEVSSTTSPIEALEMIKQQKYHIVLSDIVMPKMDGIDFLTQVKQYDALTQVIMMTGYSTMDKTMRCLEAGANDYILKPFKNLAQLAEIVKISEDKLKRWWDNMRGNFA
ncbi:response regulator [Pelosinus sp. sgz500959]|uniref:response regulator n=1 Tax=Pelosinus sp. sgz500959 TaxID=3242472 RepID=UPI00366EADA5